MLSVRAWYDLMQPRDGPSTTATRRHGRRLGRTRCSAQALPPPGRSDRVRRVRGPGANTVVAAPIEDRELARVLEQLAQELDQGALRIGTLLGYLRTPVPTSCWGSPAWPPGPGRPPSSTLVPQRRDGRTTALLRGDGAPRPPSTWPSATADTFTCATSTAPRRAG